MLIFFAECPVVLKDAGRSILEFYMW